MALVRCESHGKPKGRTLTYVKAVKPIGWSNTAAICGGRGCENPGMIWLTDDEAAAYNHGQRIFSFNNASTKVKVQ